MAKTGRPKLATPRRQATIYIEPRYLHALDMIDHDPFLDRRSYGTRNQHIERAISEYLEKHHPEIAKKFL
jgi:hypothetical protein